MVRPSEVDITEVNGVKVIIANGRGVKARLPEGHGKSTGFFLQEENSNVERVDNLNQLVQAKMSGAQEHESPDIRAIQLVEGQWGLYLETF